MRSLHRATAGGGFGVLAMAAVAGSVAFACTPGGIVQSNGSTTLNALQGDMVPVEAKRFADHTTGNHAYGPVRFTWNSKDGAQLASLSAPTSSEQSTTTRGVTFSVWAANITIPADAALGQNFIVASQTKANGDLYLTGSMQVYVQARAVVDPSSPQGPAVTPAVVNAQPVFAAPGQVPSNPSNGPVAQATNPAVAPAVAATPTAPGSPVANPTPTPASAAQPAASVADSATPVPAPTANELWSGLSTPSAALLDAPASASTGSGLPAGAALLAMGVVALAGTATVTGRRRLAIAKATRS